LDPTDLDTGVPVPDELDLGAGDTDEQQLGAEEVDRLLAGRFFTIGNGGTVSAWNPRAQGVFGFASAAAVGEGFVQKLIAPAEREKRATEI
jgi:hypothetical protein